MKKGEFKIYKDDGPPKREVDNYVIGDFRYYGMRIFNNLTIRGAQWGKDGRDRSVVGIGMKLSVFSDPKESTIIFGDGLRFGLLQHSEYLDLDGLTFTSQINGNVNLAIIEYPPKATQWGLLIVNNCIFRNIYGPKFIYAVVVWRKGTFHIKNSSFRDMEPEHVVKL